MARGDNFDGAEKILTKIRNLDSSHSYIQHEMSEIRRQVEERSTNRMSKKAQFNKLFQKGVRNRMAIGLSLMFLQSFTGDKLPSHVSMSAVLTHNTEYHNLLRAPYLRNPRYLRHVPQALLHRLLRHLQDPWDVHLYLRRG